MVTESILFVLKKTFERYGITEIGDKVVFTAQNGEHYILTSEILKEMVEKQISEADYVKRNFA